MYFICCSVSFSPHSSPIKNERWPPRLVAVVALVVPPGPVNVGSRPREDGTLELGLAGLEVGGD